MRLCKPCGIKKPLSEFSRDSGECGGHRYYCKACAKLKKDAYLLRRKQAVNQSKFEQAHRGLSAIAKKVFDAVPISEGWSPTQIGHEMTRQGSGGGEVRITLGCLNTLIDMGLVSENGKGLFQRVGIRQKAVAEIQPIEKSTVNKTSSIAPVTASAKPYGPGPIEILSKLSSRLRELASDMDTAALELAEQVEKNDVETAKMRQLQALLKSLG